MFSSIALQLRMHDPVIAADGQTYERSAIEGWLATQGSGPPRSPVTGQLMSSAALLPNLAIRDLVHAASAASDRQPLDEESEVGGNGAPSHQLDCADLMLCLLIAEHEASTEVNRLQNLAGSELT